MKKIYKTKISAAIHETAEGLYNAGGLDKKTMREFDESCLVPVEKLTPDEIRAIRDDSLASQSVFARFLGVTPGLISQWERGEKSPSGPSLKLLALVKSKGLDAIAHYAEEETGEIEDDEQEELEVWEHEAHAVAARYNATTGDLALTLRGGARLSVAVEMLQEMAGASPQLIEQVELWDDGRALHWEKLGADLRVQEIVAGSFGTALWMEKLEERGLLGADFIERHHKAAELQDQFEQAQAIQATIGRLSDVTGLIDQVGIMGAIGKTSEWSHKIPLIESQIFSHDHYGEARATEFQERIKDMNCIGDLAKQVNGVRILTAGRGRAADIHAIAANAAEAIRAMGDAPTMGEQTNNILAVIALTLSQLELVGPVVADSEDYLRDEPAPKQSRERESDRDRELYRTRD